MANMQYQYEKLFGSKRFYRFAMRHQRTFLILVFEFTGTLCYAYGNLVAVSSENISNNLFRGAVSSFMIPLLLYVMFAWANELTGAHFNPAVTAAFMVRSGPKRVPVRYGLIYMLSEVAGALAGTALAYGVGNINTSPPITTMPLKTAFFSFAMESFGTMILVFFVMHSSTPETNFCRNRFESHIFIPLILITAREESYRSQGLNPAFAIAFQLGYCIKNGQWQIFKQFWAIFLGPFFGSMFAVILFQFIYRRFVLVYQKRQQLNKQTQEVLQMQQKRKQENVGVMEVRQRVEEDDDRTEYFSVA